MKECGKCYWSTNRKTKFGVWYYCSKLEIEVPNYQATRCKEFIRDKDREIEEGGAFEKETERKGRE